MTEEQKDQYEREVAFANDGKLVLNNRAYKESMTVRRVQIFEVFCNTSKEQDEVREEAWRTMKNLDALEEYFRLLLGTGKMAEISLKSLTE